MINTCRYAFVLFLMPGFASLQLLAQSIDSAVGNYSIATREIVSDLVGDPDRSLAAIGAISLSYPDSMSPARDRAIDAIRMLGAESPFGNVRMAAAARLVNVIGSNDAGLSARAVAALRYFKKHDFSAESREQLKHRLVPETPGIGLLLRVIGYFSFTELMPPIRQMVVAGAPPSIRWDALLALARMGDEVASDMILSKLSKVTVNDDFVYDVVPDLVYTRDRRIFSFLEKLIQSDKSLCSCADPDSRREIPCSFAIVAHMAPVIANFSLKTDEFGDLITRDPSAALAECREWFGIQGGNYEIVPSGF